MPELAPARHPDALYERARATLRVVASDVVAMAAELPAGEVNADAVIDFALRCADLQWRADLLKQGAIPALTARPRDGAGERSIMERTQAILGGSDLAAARAFYREWGTRTMEVTPFFRGVMMHLGALILELEAVAGDAHV